MPVPEGRLRILIVDDSKTSRLALESILSPYGDCDLAGNGEDAIKAFSLAWERNNPYDLICMDIMMPKVDGIQALKMIRKMEREMGVMQSEASKVVMISAVDNPRYIFEAYHQGRANAYIYKPLDKQKILEELKKLNLTA